MLKYTLKQLKELALPPLHPLPVQRTIGSIYFNQLRLTALRRQAADLEQAIVLNALKQIQIP